jgi:heat-inducible transcriptional repressor
MTRPITDATVQSPTLQTLDMRSRDIFRRIVDSYLRDGEPVGSRSLSRIRRRRCLRPRCATS